MIESLFLIIFLLITIIYLYNTHESELNHKYINNVDIENNYFFENLNSYFNNINSYLEKLSIKKIKYDLFETTDIDSKIKLYIKNYKNVHEHLNNQMCENIKVKKFFTKK